MLGGLGLLTPDDVDSAIETLRNGRGNVRCQDLVRMLRDLGFSVAVRARSPGHHTFYHPADGKTIFGNFDCGHGRNPVPKRPYVLSVIRALETLRDHITKSGAGDV